MKRTPFTVLIFHREQSTTTESETTVIVSPDVQMRILLTVTHTFTHRLFS